MTSTSSFAVFLRYIGQKDGTANVKEVFSTSCFQAWLASRNFPPKRPEESFRKAITSHCRGVDGRKPFPEEIEKALLIEMRKKQVWPCFVGTKFNIGKRGYQVKGFWETTKETSTKRKRRMLHQNNFVQKRIKNDDVASISSLSSGLVNKFPLPMAHFNFPLARPLPLSLPLQNQQQFGIFNSDQLYPSVYGMNKWNVRNGSPTQTPNLYKSQIFKQMESLNELSLLATQISMNNNYCFQH